MPLRKRKKTESENDEERKKLELCNSCPSHFSACNISRTYSKNDKRFSITGARASDFNNKMKEDIFQLFASNMQTMYETSSFGWNPRRKKRELFSPTSNYLLAHNGKVLAAYIHFQFCWDDDDEPQYAVCYVYELQIDTAYQGLGLGRWLMDQMKEICRQWKLRTITLTCLKSNVSAMAFYTKLGYTPDASSPSMFGLDADYEILSLPVNN